jgi:methyl-accepting chemotaxis protein
MKKRNYIVGENNSNKKNGRTFRDGKVLEIMRDKLSTDNDKTKRRSVKGLVNRLNSIRTKLVLAFLVPVILIIVLGTLSYLKSSKGLIESYESSTLSTMDYMAKYLDFGLNIVSDKADAISDSDEIIKYYSGVYKNDIKEEESRFQEMKTYVTREIISMDYISNFFVFSGYSTGFSGSGMVTSELGYDDFSTNGEGKLLENSNGEGVWVGRHPYLDTISGTKDSVYAISYIRYIKNLLNKPTGYIIVDVSYEYINKIISESGFPDGSVVAFVTGDGRTITSDVVPEGFEFSQQKYDENQKEDGKLDHSEYLKINSKDYLFTYEILDSSGSMLCSLIPKDVIVKKANEVKNITFLMVVIASIIAIALGNYMAYGFSNTIKKINSVLHKTQEGNLTCYTSIKRKDEFHILGASINDVIDSMQKLISKMTGTSDTVSDSALSVSNSSGILVSATKNISDAVNGIENGTAQQAVNAEECLRLMADLAEKINELYRGAHNIEQIAGNAENIIVDGIDIVDNLTLKVKDTTDITRTVINDIEDLEKLSKSISGIIVTINEIAGQTNLLSLNASIEAARAGEFGRGFSVVASEIRKLADQSLTASNEIAEIIRHIEDKTKKTVTTAKQAESIVLSQGEALASTVSVFTDINKHVGNLTENINQITGDVEGIERAKNDTLEAIESISAASQETAAATEQLSVIAMNQMGEVNKLQAVVDQLNDDAGSLTNAVSVFKIK